MPVLGAIVLASFIKLLFATDSPRFCAGVYTGLATIGVALRIGLGDIHVGLGLCEIVLTGVFSWAYFSVLQRVNPWTGAWWAVAIGGPILAGIVLAYIG